MTSEPTATNPTTPPGWYDDGTGYSRWWDGRQWGAYHHQWVAQTTSVAEPRRRGGPVTALVGAVLAAVGSLGPWISIMVLTATGTDGDGQLTLIAALAGAALAGGSFARPRLGWGALGCGLVVAGIAIYHLATVGSHTTELLDQTLTASAGWGLWLTAAGGLGMVAGGLVAAASAGRPSY